MAAITAVNVQVAQGGAAYSVPTGNLFIGRATYLGGSDGAASACRVLVNTVQVVELTVSSSGGFANAPYSFALSLNAGDQVTVTASSGALISLCGNLYPQ